MPDDTHVSAPATNRDLATLPIDQAIEAFTPDLAAALPANISVAHFKRMALTAISINPDLRYCDRRTLFNALVKCASDGLLPDGREAALVSFKTKIKVRGRDGEMHERKIDAASYLPMVAGLRKRMRNSGDVVSAVAEVVYRNDTFHYRLGDDGSIEHLPPPLDQDRGDPVGAYSIIRLRTGEVVREVMGLRDINRARAFSRAKDGPAWSNWWTEMARKTVLRRAAKSVPQDSAMVALLDRDDEALALPSADAVPLMPPRPVRADFATPAEAEPEPDDGPPEYDPEELPEHVLVREEVERDEDIDDNGGEMPIEDEQDAERLRNSVSERNPFWSQPKLFVAPVRHGDRADWSATRQTLLMLIGQAETADELRRLAADSKPTINSVTLAEKSTVIGTAIAERIKTLSAEIRDAAGNRLSVLDAG